MLIAIVDNERVFPEKGIIGICPSCKKEVIPVCGELNIHHWRHSKDESCEFNRESETEWHRSMKSLFDKEYIEVFDGKCRADIKLKHGLVLEFQNSSITLEDIEKRKNNYDRLVWIFNLSRQFENGQIQFEGDNMTYVRPKRVLWFCTPRLFLYFRDNLICQVNKISKSYHDEYGYNILTYHARTTDYTIDEFRDYVIELDYKFS